MTIFDQIRQNWNTRRDIPIKNVGRGVKRAYDESVGMFASNIPKSFQTLQSSKNLEQQARQLSIDNTNRLLAIKRARESGDTTRAKQLAELNLKQTTNQRNKIATKSKQIEDIAKQGQKDAISSGAKTALVATGVYAGVPALVGSAGISGGISSGMAAMTGKDPYEALGYGIGVSPQYAGLNKLTSPIIDPLVESSGRLMPTLTSKLVGRGLAHGGLNVGEDIGFTLLTQGRMPTADENINSFVIGALTSPLIKYDPEASFFKVVDDGKVKINREYLRNAKGQFAKDLSEAKLVRAAGKIESWLNEEVPIPINRNGEMVEELMPRWRMVRQEGGFVKPDELIPGTKTDVQPTKGDIIQTRNKAIKERLKTLGVDDKRLKVLDKKPKLLVAGGDKIDNAKVQEWATPVSNRLPAQAGPSKIDDPGRNVSLRDIEQKVYGSTTPEKTEFGGEKTGAGAVTDKLRGVQEDASVKVVGKMLESDNQAVRTIGRLLQGFGGNLGKSQEQVAKRAEFKGSGTDYANKIGTDTQKYVNDLIGNDPKSSERIWSVMDPERADTKVKYSDLNNAEKEALEFLRDISDFINELNYKNGFIKKTQYEKMRGGKYIARAYEEIDLPPEVADFYKAGGGKLDLGQFKQRKEDVDLTSIKDPAYLMGKRLQQALYNDALSEMTGWMSKTDLVSDVKKPGYTKLSEHRMYGDLSGKYIKKDALEDIKGFYFTNDISQQAYDLISWYDRNPIRRGYKKLFTIFNPAVRLGNKTSNYVFAWMNGINPATYKKNLSFAKQEFEGSGELYRRMLKDGLVGTDVTKADITRMAQELKVGVDDPSILKQIDDSLTSGYGKTDDMAKISAMKTFLDRGYEYDEAARRVMNGFQNYRTVGWLYDVGAKIPVLGNPFIRFKADLGRILKNGVLEHPFRTASTIVAWKLFTDLMSRASGESAEDKQTREERFGSPRIPLTNVSLAVQTPFGEINAARLIGAYGTNYGDSSNDTLADISDFSPIKDPTDVRNYGSDPVIGPIISTLTDTDFRGKSIKDPDKSKYRESQLTPGEQNANRVKFLARAFTPPVINSALDINAAMKGEENFYGKVRTPGQAILRTYPGIKIEQFGPEEAQASREKDATYAKNRNDYLQREITSIKKGILSGDIEESVGQRRIANFVNQMKDVGGGVPNVEASGAFTIPASKEDRELLKDVIKTKIEINSASPKELEYYYLYDALKMPSENRYETALKEDSLWGAVGKIEKDESLPPEQQAQLIKKVADEMGLKPAHIAYQRVARQNNDKKTLFAMDRLDKAKTDKERMDILVSGRLFVDGDYILSNGVIDNLVDEGYIDYGEGETLKKMKIDPKTGKAIQTGRLKKGTRSSSSKSGKAVTGLKTYKSTPVQFGGSKLPTLRLTL